MATIKNFFKSSKRARQESSNSEKSDSSTHSPPSKKLDPDYSKDSNDSFLNYLDNIQEDNCNMEYLVEQFEGNNDMPTWAKHMFGKLCSMDSKIDDTRARVDSFISGLEFLENRLSNVIQVSKDNTESVVTINTQLQNLQSKCDTLESKINEMENYSKRYNIKIFNIEDNPRETPNELRGKLGEILEGMNLNISDFYIDNLHRLPPSGNGPRPVIVKFISALDRNLVWSRKSMLSHTKLQFREHFCKQTEDSIKLLLPVRRAALDQKLKVKLVVDKLYINNTKYTVNTLNALPECLQHSRFGCKVLENKLFFFSGASPLSNFHPASFTVEGLNYSCGEQFLQWKKAILFKCDSIAKEIMNTSNPANMKRLGGKIPNFNPKVWNDNAPEIALQCQKNRFEQNPSLKSYLLKTAPNKLYEASPRDSVWGIGCSMSDPEILKKEKNWGQNIQGKTLEVIRNQLC
jgi:ribA/ribD-fused uncharacterized protein